MLLLRACRRRRCSPPCLPACFSIEMAFEVSAFAGSGGARGETFAVAADEGVLYGASGVGLVRRIGFGPLNNPASRPSRPVLDDIAARDLDTSQGPPLNAFLTLNASALAQAEELDKRTEKGEPRGRLHCVPVAVKDNFETADLPMSVGSLALAKNQADAAMPISSNTHSLRPAASLSARPTWMNSRWVFRGLSGAGWRVGNAYNTRMSPGRLVEWIGCGRRIGLRAARPRQRQLRIAAHSRCL